MDLRRIDTEQHGANTTTKRWTVTETARNSENRRHDDVDDGHIIRIWKLCECIQQKIICVYVSDAIQVVWTNDEAGVRCVGVERATYVLQ